MIRKEGSGGNGDCQAQTPMASIRWTETLGLDGADSAEFLDMHAGGTKAERSRSSPVGASCLHGNSLGFKPFAIQSSM